MLGAVRAPQDSFTEILYLVVPWFRNVPSITCGESKDVFANAKGRRFEQLPVVIWQLHTIRPKDDGLTGGHSYTNEDSDTVSSRVAVKPIEECRSGGRMDGLMFDGEDCDGVDE
jgi:hypothetical protein